MQKRLWPHTFIVITALSVALLLTLTRDDQRFEKSVRASPGAKSLKKTKHNLTAIKVINSTLLKVRDSYVDPARISPKKMLYAALDSVQQIRSSGK